MQLLTKKKTFTKENKQYEYDSYYVVVYGREIELKPVNNTDKSLLKVGFTNGK